MKATAVSYLKYVLFAIINVLFSNKINLVIVTCNLRLEVTISKLILSLSFFIKLGDNCIQNDHLGRYIFRDMVGNLVA